MQHGCLPYGDRNRHRDCYPALSSLCENSKIWSYSYCFYANIYRNSRRFFRKKIVLTQTLSAGPTVGHRPFGPRWTVVSPHADMRQVFCVWDEPCRLVPRLTPGMTPMDGLRAIAGYSPADL